MNYIRIECENRHVLNLEFICLGILQLRSLKGVKALSSLRELYVERNLLVSVLRSVDLETLELRSEYYFKTKTFCFLFAMIYDFICLNRY